MRGPSLECPWTPVSEANSTAATRPHHAAASRQVRPCTSTPLRRTPRRTGRRRRRQEPRPARRSGHLRALALSGLGALALVGRLTLTCGSADLREPKAGSAPDQDGSKRDGAKRDRNKWDEARWDRAARTQTRARRLDRSQHIPPSRARRARTCATAAGSSQGTGRRHSASLPKLYRGSWRGSSERGVRRPPTASARALGLPATRWMALPAAPLPAGRMEWCSLMHALAALCAKRRVATGSRLPSRCGGSKRARARAHLRLHFGARGRRAGGSACTASHPRLASYTLVCLPGPRRTCLQRQLRQERGWGGGGGRMQGTSLR
jgi:hypothetical protein